jgi:hypothetical protein
MDADCVGVEVMWHLTGLPKIERPYVYEGELDIVSLLCSMRSGCDTFQLFLTVTRYVIVLPQFVDFFKARLP